MFGAQIYVANLIGMSMASEVGAVMTAIIMAGRTGAAYAAQIGTMQVNQEIDALKTMGLEPMDFLVLPRMLALILMMPLLYLYANLLGMFGGGIIAVTVLGMTPNSSSTSCSRRAAVVVVTGLIKSGVFGILVALSGCMQGINCGRSAAAVGDATTSAVVMAIVAIIVGDGIFGVLAPPSRCDKRRTMSRSHGEPIITVDHLTMAFGDFVVQKDLSSRRSRRHLCHHGRQRLRQEHAAAPPDRAAGAGSRQGLLRQGKPVGCRPAAAAEFSGRTGILYQSGALFTSMTLAENVALPLQTYTDLAPAEIRDIVSTKLALVGLAGYEDFFPSAISGGMMKRAGLARAMALDPEILFFDEPSAGLDPITSKRLDDLIRQLRDDLGATIVMVTHELPSIFAIADNSVFLDNVKRTSPPRAIPRR